MSVGQQNLSKGPGMEELLRDYFLKAGFFVARGVPFIYETFDVTDIDIWLYSRTSSVSREITIVDSKHKKTPQAIERIFWVQGLRIATKATSAIVATTDRRPEVKEFGRELGVLVLDGAFLQKLSISEKIGSDRLSDEELFQLISSYALNKLDGDWKGRIKFSKSLLANSLSFDSCNLWLSQARFFAEQSITKEKQKEIALRCFYLICSFLSIAIDYCMKEISFYDTADRSRLLKDGFTYGSRGDIGLKKILNLTMGLVEQYANEGPQISKQVRMSVERQMGNLNTTILGEYFSKNEVAKNLFSIAKELEQLAMNRTFIHHSKGSVELRSLVYCLLDFWGINRKLFS